MTLPLNLYTASQVRELDQIAIKEFGIPGYTLMKRAGQATFEILRNSYPDVKSICVVCGAGNNGGDGYVIATLAIQAGLQVALIQLGDKQSIKGDALTAREAYLQAGSKETSFDEGLLDVDLIVDAIFGTGLTRAVEGEWADAINAINACRTRSQNKVVAVDIPSGLNSDTGIVLGTCIKADTTVTYIGLKCGLLTGQARDYVSSPRGTLEFDNLHIPKEVYGRLSTKSNRRVISHRIIQQKLSPRSRTSHKGSYGHVLFIGGASGMSGAIRLAAEAGLRAGAGLVTVATDSSHAAWLNLSRPELMVVPIKKASDLQPLLEKISVIAIGPGLGQSDWAKELLVTVLEADKPKIIDADALNLLSRLSLSSRLNNDQWVLTPHPAEAARLLSSESTVYDAREIENDRYKSVEMLQKKYGGVCVLKGAGTLVAAYGNKVMVCTEGNPGMASGGMGDVLTGIIASLVAQGLSLSNGASLGVFLHAKAADLAAEKGEIGLLASDLFPFIRLLLNGLDINSQEFFRTTKLDNI